MADPTRRCERGRYLLVKLTLWWELLAYYILSVMDKGDKTTDYLFMSMYILMPSLLFIVKKENRLTKGDPIWHTNENDKLRKGKQQDISGIKVQLKNQNLTANIH